MMPSRIGIVFQKPLKKLEKTIAAASVIAGDGRRCVRLTPLVGSAIGYRHIFTAVAERPEADDDDHRADEGRRQELVEPPGADQLDDAGDDHVDEPGRHEAAERRGDVLAARAPPPTAMSGAMNAKLEPR